MKKTIGAALTAALMAGSFLTAAQPAAAQPDGQDRRQTQAQANAQAEANARAKSQAQAQAQVQSQAQVQQRDNRERGGQDRGRTVAKPQSAPQAQPQAQAPAKPQFQTLPTQKPQQQGQTQQRGPFVPDNRNGRDNRGPTTSNRGAGDRTQQFHPQPNRGDRDRGRPRYDPRRYPREIHPRQRYYWRGPVYRYPPGFYVNQWAYGDILPWGWYGSDYYIDNWYWYGLEPPPAGFEWVREGRDAILVDVFTGRVYEVVYGLFW